MYQDIKQHGEIKDFNKALVVKFCFTTVLIKAKDLALNVDGSVKEFLV